MDISLEHYLILCDRVYKQAFQEAGVEIVTRRRHYWRGFIWYRRVPMLFIYDSTTLQIASFVPRAAIWPRRWRHLYDRAHREIGKRENFVAGLPLIPQTPTHERMESE